MKALAAILKGLARGLIIFVLGVPGVLMKLGGDPRLDKWVETLFGKWFKS